MNKATEVSPDETDCLILECYRQDPNLTARAIGEKIKLSENAVRERTKKLTSSGILSFAVGIDYDRVSSFSIEAYVEVEFPGNANIHQALQKLVADLDRQEIREAITLVGDVDALIRVRARNVADLRELVSEIRASPQVVGTRSRIVAGRWWHGTDFGRAASRKSH